MTTSKQYVELFVNLYMKQYRLDTLVHRVHSGRYASITGRNLTMRDEDYLVLGCGKLTECLGIVLSLAKTKNGKPTWAHNNGADNIVFVDSQSAVQMRRASLLDYIRHGEVKRVDGKHDTAGLQIDLLQLMNCIPVTTYGTLTTIEDLKPRGTYTNTDDIDFDSIGTEQEQDDN